MILEVALLLEPILRVMELTLTAMDMEPMWLALPAAPNTELQRKQP